MNSNSLKSTFNMTMWSASNIDLRNVDLILEQFRKTSGKFEPTPYTFTKIENGKKIIAETSCFSPPTWLMLDHAIAVVWAMFSQLPQQHQLTIDDLKWAYEFLKQIKNKKGENPPDVKVCLKEIQDRLIVQYARLTSLQEEDFDEIAAVFGDKVITDSTSDCVPFLDCKSERTTSLTPGSTSSLLLQTPSSKDLNKGSSGKPKKNPVNYLMQTYPILEDDYESNIFEDPEDVPDEEVEKYILTLFGDEKKQDLLQAKSSIKSMIPTARKPTQNGFLNEQETVGDAPSREKTTKKVRCVAEMRSVKFQKSTKVQDNGEEAAYSNLKAEIRRLTINPNFSKDEIMKYLKDWKTERLHNELKRLNSIEEFMKNLGKDEVDSSLRTRSPLKIKEIKTTKATFSRLGKFTI